MDALLVLNELSVPAGREARDAVEALNGLASLLLDGRLPIRKRLVAPPGLLQTEPSPGLSIGRWLSGYSTRNPDRRRRVKLLFDRRAEYGQLAGPDPAGAADEFLVGDRISVGAALAQFNAGLAISLLTSGAWDTAFLTLTRNWLGPDGDILSAAEEVAHASRPDHLDQHLSWARRHAPTPGSGAQLWDARSELFPNLTFCERVGDDLRGLGGDGPRLRAARRGLSALQIYCEGRNGAPFRIQDIPGCSGESPSTMQRYSAERAFRCPDGAARIFEWHRKQGDLRVYFMEAPDEPGLLVGYVGAHLRTALFN